MGFLYASSPEGKSCKATLSRPGSSAAVVSAERARAIESSNGPRCPPPRNSAHRRTLMRSRQDPRRAPRLARRPRRPPHGHLAPPGSRRKSSSPVALAPRRDFSYPEWIRGHPRQWRVHRLLGRRRLRPHRTPQPEPRVRRVRWQVCGRRIRPWLEAPDIRKAEPGSRSYAEPVDGVDVYAWTHNETSTGVAAAVERVEVDGRSRSSMPPAPRAESTRFMPGRRLLLRATEEPRIRRRHLVRPRSSGCDRTH